MRSHSTEDCPDQLAESFWMPSYCPNGLRGARGLDALIDAESVEWDGGRYVTAYYRCPCCDSTWSEPNWPVVFLFGNEHMPAVRAASGSITGRRYISADDLRRPNWRDKLLRAS